MFVSFKLNSTAMKPSLVPNHSSYLSSCLPIQAIVFQLRHKSLTGVSVKYLPNIEVNGIYFLYLSANPVILSQKTIRLAGHRLIPVR